MRIQIHVIPGSSRSDAEPGDPWRIHVHARPTEGKANEEVLLVISRHFGVPCSAVHIVSGYTSRNKTVEVGLRESAMGEERR